MSSTPLRVAFLWHQHQPYYKWGDHYLLPWARLHATKDYLDMALALEGFPGIRQTINVVPSLLIQLEDYVSRGASDVVLDLTRRSPGELGADDQLAILRAFFLCNVERMIAPFPRYAELLQRAGGEREDSKRLAAARQAFSEQDWLDLQVWYTLAWIGPWSAEREPFASLLAQGTGFTDVQKRTLIDASLELVSRVIPTYRSLMERGQLELSVTPFYHPILPILCDSYSALEASPAMQLPSTVIRWPEDARAQVERAVAMFEEHFGRRPQGMWPSEGSVSDGALAVIAQTGLSWAATDEGILRRTLGENWFPTARYFPWSLRTAAGDIRVIFRDRQLSDAIGFVYSAMDPRAAASDFYQRLVEIRGKILQDHGPAAIEQALVPVILDGENCWEYYLNNGRPFLEALYDLLSESAEIVTSTVSEALSAIPPSRDRTVGHIFSGSWIGSDFRIWIGHEEDNDAWQALASARATLMAARDRLDEKTFAEAMEEVFIAEGSDWYWWFGDEHSAINQDDFDLLFRYHVRRVYELIGEPAPHELDVPIRRARRGPSVAAPTSPISPKIDGSRSLAWEGAGSFAVERVGGAMHRGDAFERRILFGADEHRLYLRFDTQPLGDDEVVRLKITGINSATVEFTSRGASVALPDGQGPPMSFNGIEAAIGDSLMLALPLTLLSGSPDALASVSISGALFEGTHQTERFPHSGEVFCPLGTRASDQLAEGTDRVPLTPNIPSAP